MVSLRRNSVTLLLVPALVLVLGIIVIPSTGTLVLSVMDPDPTLKHFSVILSGGAYTQVLLHTMMVAAVVAFGTLVLGYPVAYFIVSQPASRQVGYLFVFLIPMWMSVLIRSYTWLTLLGREGVLNSLLISSGIIDSPLRLAFNSGAVYAAMIQILLPFQVINCYTAMKDVDPDLMRAARVLGASPLAAVRRVFVPLSLDGSMTGTAIVFMMATGFFITPALVGGAQDVLLGNLISQHLERFNHGFAAALGIVLITSSLACVLVIRKAGRLLARQLV